MSEPSHARTFEGPRPARPADLPQVLETVNLIARAVKGAPPTIGSEYPHIYCGANADNILIFTSGNQVVGSVAIWTNEVEIGAARLKVGGINCLVVRPEHRRAGLGRRLMEAAHERMRAAGCHLGLLTTLISAWYRKLGWELATCAWTFHVNRSNVGLLPAPHADLRLRIAGEDGLSDVLRLRHADRVGGVRTEASLRGLWPARGRSKIVLGEKSGVVSAYLMGSETRIAEWGGRADVLAPLLRAWFESTDTPEASTSLRDAVSRRSVIRGEMTITAPPGLHPFVDLLKDAGLPLSIGYGGMIRLLEPQGVLRALGHPEIRITEQDGNLTFRRGSETCTLSVAQAAKLLFGPEHPNGFAADVLPLPFWQWQIEHV